MKKKQKIFFIANLFLIAAICIGNYFYLSFGGMKLQVICSGLFVFIGAINLFYAALLKNENLKFNILMSVGLVFAFFADMLIAHDFIIGALLFGLGHISFFIAYCTLENFTKKDLIVSAIVFFCGGSLIMFSPFLEIPDDIMQTAGLIYAFIISVMTGKAISNFIRMRNLLTKIILIGSVLFFLSDLMLVFDWFLGRGSTAWIFCIGMYYPAQCLLAFSSFLSVEEPAAQ